MSKHWRERRNGRSSKATGLRLETLEQRVLLDVPGTSYGARRPPTLKLYPTRQDALRALVLEALDDSTPF